MDKKPQDSPNLEEQGKDNTNVGKPNALNPDFKPLRTGDPLSTPEAFQNHLECLGEAQEPLPHGEIVTELLAKVETLDFRKEAGLDENNEENERLKNNHFLIITIQKLLEIATENDWGMCRNLDFIYLYNGAYWNLVEKNDFTSFLGEVAEKMGVDQFKAQYYTFRDQLFKQFLALANLPKPEPQPETVLINLRNGTFEISPGGTRLRPFDRRDFITYQLPFAYNQEAEAPKFKKYLNRILPDQERQRVICEYLGYVFIHPALLKLEKTLLLYGTGANGKSVLFDIVNALLGKENVSSYSLQSLTNENGYFRAKLANKLVNYASEISGNLETAIFKQLVSGEPVEARLPYGEPFTLSNYAKLIFNVNELPRDVEHTNAYFRRFLIIPFDVTIPEHEQDKELSKKIIENELEGVFNWILEGLNRLLKQKKFSDCEAAKLQVEQYRIESDTVQLFLNENGFEKSTTETLLKDLYRDYKNFCIDDGYRHLNKTNFGRRLEGIGIQKGRVTDGICFYVSDKPY
jgi:putative DNA primase/helicase